MSETQPPRQGATESEPTSDIAKVMSATWHAVLLQQGPHGFPGELDPDNPEVLEYIAMLIAERNQSPIPRDRLASEFIDEIAVQVAWAKQVAKESKND